MDNLSSSSKSPKAQSNNLHHRTKEKLHREVDRCKVSSQSYMEELDYDGNVPPPVSPTPELWLDPPQLSLIRIPYFLILGTSRYRIAHDDPLVIEATIANYTVKRVLVDGASSAELLFYPSFCSLGLRLDHCQPYNICLLGFSSNQVPVLGILPLHVRIGNGDQTTETLVNFHVVNCSSAYNGILGRPFLHKARAVPSTFHLKLKFPTLSGVGCVRRDQSKQFCAFSLNDRHVITVDT
ncbi:unnamed protein product [Linum trigynum]|uniref:Uncharacterized protein n=1 Tax=Linum trigynum TaxID=586398 RepID=A0AAV2FBF2_9ROSI